MTNSKIFYFSVAEPIEFISVINNAAIICEASLEINEINENHLVVFIEHWCLQGCILRIISATEISLELGLLSTVGDWQLADAIMQSCSTIYGSTFKPHPLLSDRNTKLNLGLHAHTALQEWEEIKSEVLNHSTTIVLPLYKQQFKIGPNFLATFFRCTDRIDNEKLFTLYNHIYYCIHSTNEYKTLHTKLLQQQDKYATVTFIKEDYDTFIVSSAYVILQLKNNFAVLVSIKELIKYNISNRIYIIDESRLLVFYVSEHCLSQLVTALLPYSRFKFKPKSIFARHLKVDTALYDKKSFYPIREIKISKDLEHIKIIKFNNMLFEGYMHLVPYIKICLPKQQKVIFSSEFLLQYFKDKWTLTEANIIVAKHISTWDFAQLIKYHSAEIINENNFVQHYVTNNLEIVNRNFEDIKF
jgi:hypothetical protein